jgi:hypothetical protein
MASKIDARKFHSFLEAQTGMEHDPVTIAQALALLPQFNGNATTARRGRPPKAEGNGVLGPAEVIPVPAEHVTEPPKRRGRPPKTEVIDSRSEPAAEPPKRRGRPPGSTNKPKAETPVRRGRPPAKPRPDVAEAPF